MQKKNGISLIVLVITIIVMIILATAVIISLTNSGIINKANEAVAQTNLKQVQQIASLAWAEAYADGKTSEAELKSAVETALATNKIDTSKYNVNVTTSGVSVELKSSTTGTQSEYGFYYDRLYLAEVTEEGETLKIGYVFRENNSIEMYIANEATNNILFCDYVAENVNYDEAEGASFTEDGSFVTLDGLICYITEQEIHGVYYNREYTAVVGGTTVTAVLGTNGALKTTQRPSMSESTEATVAVKILGNGNIITDSEETTVIANVSVDGKKVLSDGIVLTLTDKTAENPEVAMWYDGWEAAYVYDGTSWSDKVLASSIEGIESITVEQAEQMGYNIIAKFYKLDSQTSEVTYSSRVFPASYAYKMVISGNGSMGDLGAVDYGSNSVAWYKDFMNYLQGTQTDLPLIAYTTEIIIEEGITSISSVALAYTLASNSIYIPSSVSAINLFSFFLSNGAITVEQTNANYCSVDGILYDKKIETVIACPSSKSKVVLPNTVKDIGTAFISNTGITEVVVPEGVTIIEGDAFWNCSKLHTITLPSTLQTIGNIAFDGTVLTTVNYAGSETDWNNISIGENNEPLINATKVYNYEY